MLHELPDSLLSALKSQQYLPVVGWGFPDFAPGPIPRWRNPTDAKNRRSSWGRREAEKEALRWIEIAGPHVAPLFQAVASFTADCVFAVTPDPLLQQSLEYYSPGWVTLGLDQAEYPLGQRLLLPLGGRASDPQTMALFDIDYDLLKRRREILWRHAEGLATGDAPLLLLGCDSADRALRLMLRFLRPAPPHSLAGWLLCGRAEDVDREAWEHHRFHVITGPPARLLRDVVRLASGGLGEKARIRGRLVAAGHSPYKRLNYFERREAELFFGREGETRELISRVSAHRLVVVTGASGAGKTSLINAGLLAWTDEIAGMTGIYSRCGNDPVAAIGEAVTRHLKLVPGFDRTQTLTEFLLRARNHCQVVPVIVLDQAEELFTRIGQVLRDELMVALRECLIASDLLARFVLVLRDDYLARLSDLRERVPNLLQNVYSLPGLTYEGALTAIRGPSEQAGVSFSPTLAERILHDLAPGTVAPPQMQIVCSSLFEEKTGANIDEELYERLGGAEAILRRYLGDALRGLATDELDARWILKAMVTSEGTKDVLTSLEVSHRAGLPEPRVSELLLRLRDDARLLRGVQQDREQRFELAHEYLTGEIWSWMTREDITRREVEELLARELRSWRRFRHLRLGLDRLKILEANPALFDTDEEPLVLVLLSTIKHHRPAKDWTTRIARLSIEAQDRAVYQLFDYFHDRDLVQRREAAEAIALLNTAPLVRALSSPSVARRKAALEMLGGIEEKSATAAIASLLKDPIEEVRVLACGALGEIAGHAAVDALLLVAEETHTPLAGAAITALGRAADTRASELLGHVLGSHVPVQVLAAQKGIASSRTPDLVQDLLRDGGLQGESREKLWEAIGWAHWRMGQWILDVVTELSDADQHKAVKLFERWSTVWGDALRHLSLSSGPAGNWAKKALQEAKSREVKSVEVRRRVGYDLTKDKRVARFGELLSGSDHGDWWAAIRVLADEVSRGPAAKPLLLTLFRDHRPMVKAGTLAAVYNARADLGLLEPLLPDLLSYDDPTVRYFACLAAAQHGRADAVEWISRLIDDPASSFFSYYGMGKTVGDAAAYAMDKLHPAWKVWSKPSQVSFRRRES